MEITSPQVEGKGHSLDHEDRERTLDLSSLSELTGFPVDYIKKELIVEDDSLTIDNLRHLMMNLKKVWKKCPHIILVVIDEKDSSYGFTSRKCQFTYSSH